MKISVCIATYNGEKYIKQQLDSILPQLVEEDEVVVSDDSSSDKTVEIIKSYKDNRIKIYENQKFSSPIYNFEHALKHASGELIVLSDQDDIWEMNKLEIIRKRFHDRDEKFTLKMYNGRCIDESGNILEDDLFDYLKVREGLLANILKNSFIGCNIAFTKDLLDVSLPFPKNIPMHDSWLACNAYLHGSVAFVDTKVFNYRVHAQNYSLKNNSLLKKIQWRFSLVSALIQRYLHVKFTA